MGRIADNTRTIIPVTWDALSKDSRVGDSALEARIDYIESLVFGDPIPDGGEAALDALVVEFVSKLSALEIIDMAIDFWMNQEDTLTTTGTNEVVSFPDRISALEKRKKTLLADVAKLEPLVEPLLPELIERSSNSRPLLSSFDTPLLTPNPTDIGAPYAPLEA